MIFFLAASDLDHVNTSDGYFSSTPINKDQLNKISLLIAYIFQAKMYYFWKQYNEWRIEQIFLRAIAEQLENPDNTNVDLNNIIQSVKQSEQSEHQEPPSQAEQSISTNIQPPQEEIEVVTSSEHQASPYADNTNVDPGNIIQSAQQTTESQPTQHHLPPSAQVTQSMPNNIQGKQPEIDAPPVPQQTLQSIQEDRIRTYVSLLWIGILRQQFWLLCRIQTYGHRYILSICQTSIHRIQS